MKPEENTEPRSVIDTSKMNAGQRETLELTEAARAKTRRSFGGDLFMGRLDGKSVHPFPLQSAEDAAAGQPFLDELESILAHEVDSDRIDAEGEIPDALIARLAAIGAFGIKIPRDHGGLGLSQINYCRAAQLLGSVDANLTALISAHQSIGVPEPVKLFGNAEQKRTYLPRVAKGEISAFALTEVGVGSDPAQMETRAEPTPDGAHFILNGEKLWCTNGTKAGVIVVMARTPDERVDGSPRRRITAFIVEMNTPGVEVVTRCHFMGLRALYNGVIRLTNVKLPRTAILGGEGRGLKVALTTLNTGRLTIPGACTGLMKRCLAYATEWSNERVQWGAPIGKHAAIAEKLSRLASETFACESMVMLTAAIVDRDATADIRIEAAMCKLWGTEAAWRAVDETLQIRGGRGYETAPSLANRGEAPMPIERMMRDCRINLIFEGSSEIMRLFLAREALDPHLKVAGAVLDSRLPLGQRAKAGLRAAGFYLRWYPGLLLPRGGAPAGVAAAFRPALDYVARTSRRLARTLFHAMAAHGPKLERRQILLGRIVDIGTELFALSASALRADALLKQGDAKYGPGELEQIVSCIFGDTRLRIDAAFRGLRNNHDLAHYKFAQDLLAGGHRHLGSGIVVKPGAKKSPAAS
ncbi:MAG: acyl-CoA dehydrogenase family protein [Opitutaceae bacterium]|nr:acyl-CoA dehydrogenase family protein [Opitutaceae bacterium]